jgi:deoxyribose-phosphate aldolase
MTANMNSLIDHTLLKPDATITQITTLCAEAREHRFWSVCINPYWIPTVKPLLEGSGVKICTVVGFPLGATLSKAKVQETTDCILAGADEIDFVINIGAAKEGHWDFLEHEAHDIVSAAQGRLTKAILETVLLTPDEIAHASERMIKAGVNYVKTSTGFASGGATVEVVKLMRKTVGCGPGVKASGGIRDRAAAEAMIEAGATRLGTSAGVAIVSGTAAGAEKY